MSGGTAMDPRPPVVLDMVASNFKIGGLERQLLTLGRALAGEGFSPCYVGLKREGPLQDELVADPLVQSFSPAAQRGPDLGAAWRLAQHFRRRGTQVVLAANQYAVTLVALARLFQRHPPKLVVASHSNPELLGHRLRDRLQREVLVRQMRSAAAVVFVSELQRQAWAASGLLHNEGAQVVFNGIDIERFDFLKMERGTRTQLGWPPNSFVIGLCAQLRAEKQVPDLLDAARLLLDRGVEARVLLIGDGAERHAIEAHARKVLPAGHLHITGFQGDVRPWIAACDVMALVSRTEAFSISVLEAMACGRAMVLSDVGGASEQVVHGESGLLYPAGDVAALAAALARLADPVLAARVAVAARARVSENFSQQRMVARYREILLAACPGAL